MSKRFLATAIVLATCAVGSTALADDTSQTTKDTTQKKSTTTTTSKSKATSTKAKEKGAVQEVEKSTEETGASMNKAVVGEEQQAENVRQAAAPRPSAKQEQKESEAVGKTTTTAAEAIATGVQDVTRATDKPGKYNPFAIEFNPLGLFVGGRISIQAEWAPVTHNVIVLSPHFVHTTADVSLNGDNATVSQTFTGVGGEIGYRYYTGRKGMNGVFIGPSLIGGVYNASLPNGDQAFTNYGVAVDIGLQQAFGDHFVLGGGIGIEYLKVSHEFNDLAVGPSTIASTGLKPRFLLSGGYAF